MEEFVRQHAREAERQAVEQRAQRLTAARALVREHERDPNAYIVAGRTLKQAGELYEALDLLRAGLERCPPSPELHEYYIERLEKCNQTEAAIAAAQTAAQLFPDTLIFRFREALLLPVFYDSPEQIDYYRNRFTAGLHRLISEIPLATPAAAQRALEAMEKNTNKYLSYQYQNDRELTTTYGNWVHRITTINFPQWSRTLPAPAKSGDNRMRIGYVSSRFREGSVTKAFLGWLREHDRKQVAVFAYHSGAGNDAATEQVSNASEKFQQLPDSLEQAAPAILNDKLHVLVYLDIGMSPRMTLLASLRLAPVQCMAWDYPVTSGLPTIDGCFSGELMEPENADQHYSEKLVRLPGVGVCYPKPVIPTALLIKKRSDFGLREDAVIYLSPQTVFKYLPQQDELFAQIAARVPSAQFVFLVTNEVVAADFNRRLGRAFAAAGLSAVDHCVLLPEVSSLDYWNLLHLSDVVLDTIGWSGGVSTFEAVACGVPIVTLPGRFMRGRQSYAILTQLGVTETIATDANDYIDIAARLGIDKPWRQRVIDRMAAGYSDLYSDTHSVRALEDFFRQGVVNTVRQ
jgi:protein O-GlcNAc transferase